MIRHWPGGSSKGPRAEMRRVRALQPTVLERMEDRTLLSSGPTVFTVNLTSDTGAGAGSTGDLLYAITQANNNTNAAGSVITFDPSVFKPATPQPIALTQTLDLTGTAGPITIAGTTNTGVFVSGNNAVRPFTIGPGVTATFSEIAILYGLSSGNGGGILNEGTLTLSECGLAQNSAVGSGGGIENNGTMTVSGCLIGANTAEAAHGQGGGISNTGDLQLVGTTMSVNQVSGANGLGGGIANTGTLGITGCTIYENSVTAGEGAGIFTNGTATISSSTLESNTDSGAGAGGGVFNLGQLSVVDCAVTNNTSGDGGGVENAHELMISNTTIAANAASTTGGGVYNIGTMNAINVTITDNFVDTNNGGGGLFAATSTTTLVNTIVAENSQNVSLLFLADDIDGTVSANCVANLIGIGGSGGLTNGSDSNQVGVSNPGLRSLAQNGGPTESIALMSGSPAVNAGTYVTGVGTTDQRGPGFVRNFGGAIDIGAYELQPGNVADVWALWGTQGNEALATAADGQRLLPAGRNTDLPWLGISQLQIEFTQPETLTAADITISSQKGISYGPVTVKVVTLNGTTPYIYGIVFAHSITKADRVTITIAGPGLVTYTRRLDVLPGDFSDNGVVNNQDITAIRNEWKGKHGAQPTIFGEITGDGTVNGADYNAARKRNATRLPKLARPGSQQARSLLIRDLVRRELRIKSQG
jgi:hypothetical protein